MNDTINRQIHEWMGKCHTYERDSSCESNRCVCGQAFIYHDLTDYCTSLDAVSEAEKQILSQDPSCKLAERYVVALCREIGIDTSRWERGGVETWRTVLMSPADAFCLATASTKERATAIYNLIQGEK